MCVLCILCDYYVINNSKCTISSTMHVSPLLYQLYKTISTHNSCVFEAGFECSGKWLRKLQLDDALEELEFSFRCAQCSSGERLGDVCLEHEPSVVKPAVRLLQLFGWHAERRRAVNLSTWGGTGLFYLFVMQSNSLTIESTYIKIFKFEFKTVCSVNELCEVTM